MSISSIQNSGSYIHSLLNTTLQSMGVPTTRTSSTSTSGQTDNGQLSPLAQVLSTLQQLQQSNPTKYQQVTQQIATNLQQAAQTAQADGNTTAANQLNQLASNFTSASQNGQMPNIQDLAQAAGGHHHHHSQAQTSSTASTSSSSSSNPSGSSQTLSQLLAAFQSNAVNSDSLNPMSIITNTLGTAGL